MTIYGQEKDNATWALAKMNMILHGNEIAEIRKGDTITSPQFTNGDAAAAPSTSSSPTRRSRSSRGATAWRTSTAASSTARPPEKNGDYAFLLHILKSLKSTGKAAVILPHGVLFRGNAEATIRTRLLKQRLHQGHHRPARQPLLRHRHPGLHRRARQGERRTPAPASS